MLKKGDPASIPGIAPLFVFTWSKPIVNWRISPLMLRLSGYLVVGSQCAIAAHPTYVAASLGWFE
jgi:hypothetical protein